MLIKIQPDATVCRYLFTVKSLYMFRASQHPSSGVLKPVTAASGTGHNTGTVTSLQRGLIRPRWREVAEPQAAVTGFSTPDDGCCDTRNMYSDFAVNICILLHLVGFLLSVFRDVLLFNLEDIYRCFWKHSEDELCSSETLL